MWEGRTGQDGAQSAVCLRVCARDSWVWNEAWICAHITPNQPILVCAHACVNLCVCLCVHVCSVFLWPCASACVCVCVCARAMLCRGAVSFGLVVSIIRSLSFTPVSVSLFLFPPPPPPPPPPLFLLFRSPFCLFCIPPSLLIPPLSPPSLWVMTFKSSVHSLCNDERGEICPFLSVYSAFHLCLSVFCAALYSPRSVSELLNLMKLLHLNQDTLWSVAFRYSCDRLGRVFHLWTVGSKLRCSFLIASRGLKIFLKPVVEKQ